MSTLFHWFSPFVAESSPLPSIPTCAVTIAQNLLENQQHRRKKTASDPSQHAMQPLAERFGSAVGGVPDFCVLNADVGETL